MLNIKALALTIQKLFPRLKFLKKGQTQKSKSQGKKKMVPTKRSHHKEYLCKKNQSSSTHCSKVIRKVKVFKKC